jgi:hypothetical protein
LLLTFLSLLLSFPPTLISLLLSLDLGLFSFALLLFPFLFSDSLLLLLDCSFFRLQLFADSITLALSGFGICSILFVGLGAVDSFHCCRFVSYVGAAPFANALFDDAYVDQLADDVFSLLVDT